MKFDYYQRTGIFGKSGTGKTTFARYILENAPLPVVLYDLKDDIHSNKFQHIPESYLQNPQNLDYIVREHIRLQHKIVIKSEVLQDEATSQNILASLIIRYIAYYDRINRGSKDPRFHIILGIDEADVFFPKSRKANNERQREARARSLDAGYKLFSKARSVGCIGYAMSQRVQMLHNDIVGNCTQTATFNLSPNDLKTLNLYFDGVTELDFSFTDNKIPHFFYLGNSGGMWSKKQQLAKKHL